MESRVESNPVSWLLIGGFALIVAIVVATTAMTLNFRKKAIENGSRELEGSASILADHFQQQLALFLQPQTQIIDNTIAAGIRSSRDFAAEMSGDEVHYLLAAKVAGSPNLSGLSSDLSGLNLFDAEGRLINSSAIWPVPTFTIADTKSFRIFKSEIRGDETLVELVQNPVSSDQVITFSRAIRESQGALLGVATSGMTPAMLETYFALLPHNANTSVSVFLTTGILLARIPHVDGATGQHSSFGPSLRLIDRRTDGTTLRTAPIVDGVDRLVTIRPLKDMPLLLVATQTTESVLSDWRAQTRALVAVAALLGSIVAALHLLIIRQMRRQHRRSAQSLTLEKRCLDTALNHMINGLLMFDSSLRLIICNRPCFDIFGVSSEVIKPGCTLRDLVLHLKQLDLFDGDVDSKLAQILSLMSPGKPTVQLFSLNHGRKIQVQFEPLPDDGWVTTIEDVTERKRNEETISHLAHYDPLTDLPNRTLFRKRLEEASNKLADGTCFSLVYIDIDEFKSVNDALGHPIGDELLKSVAMKLQSCMGPNDVVARLGGDEFAVILCSQTSAQSLTMVVERIREMIRSPHECQGHLILTDASIGVASAPRDGTDVDQIIARADLAMYAAKSGGRRTYCFFEPTMEERTRARRQLESDLRKAAVNGQFKECGFEVHYQPVINLRTSAVLGCEALLRWRHSKRGLIPPTEFVSLAEESGLIVPLGEWVLRTACTEAANWPEPMRVAVNVSPAQFRDESFGLKVPAALAASKLSPRRLELEITEAILIRDDDAARQMLDQLRSMGIRIALDDFGTGYSSLSYLHRFLFDKIKIDRSFVEALTEPDSTSEIVKAVINIAASQGMSTTAEGVETTEQRRILRELGCTEMQGYLFSAAKTADEIRQLLVADCGNVAVDAFDSRMNGAVC